jgi:dolichol-phosphate mannosyltransferase
MRWLRFNVVGAIGFGLQLATLSLLLRWTPLPQPSAVALAVLVTVSHNFLWHERVTWRGQPRHGRWQRWVAFNLTNGAISLVTNVVVTGALVVATGISAVTANVGAVLAASLLNFIASDRLVFTRRRDPRRDDKRSGMVPDQSRRELRAHA